MRRLGLFAAIAALMACGTQHVTGVSQGARCNRACLTQLMTDYLAALDAHDISRINSKLAANAKFTEDQVERRLGSEGIWAGDVELTEYRFDIIDVRDGIAAGLVKVKENSSPVLMALRLLTQGGRITGIESIVTRTAAEGMIFNIEAIQKLSTGMAYTPTMQQRNNRDDMIGMAVRYPQGLQQGSFVKSDVPFAADAYRFENGRLMAGPGCTFLPGCDAIKTQRIPTLAKLVYRVAAVDEEQGIVLIRMDFGPGSLFPQPGRPADQSLSVFEAFKCYGNEVHAVEAFMKVKPQAQPLGWD